MIRIDHITDPLGFVLSVAFCRAADWMPTRLVVVLALVAVVAEGSLGGSAAGRHEPTALRPRRRPDAGAQPSPA